MVASLGGTVRNAGVPGWRAAVDAGGFGVTAFWLGFVGTIIVVVLVGVLWWVIGWLEREDGE